MRTAFVTGTAGFIGFHLAELLLQEGWQVAGYDGVTDYYDDPSRVDLSISCSRTEKIIGFCGFIGIDRDARKAEHYIFIGDTEFWGKGYGYYSYKMLLNFGFTELGLNRIWGYQLDGNKAAARVTASIGFKTEGLLRADIFSHGELKNRSVIAMLRDEWKNNPQFDEF